jgi:cytochrome c oxidase subunit 2
MSKTWFVGAAVAVVFLVVAACGGGDTPAPAQDDEASAQAGKELFTSLGCAACHIAGGAGGAVGPSLDGLFGTQRELASGETVTADRSYIEESIRSPAAKVAKGFPEGIMLSSFGELSGDQMHQLIDFIESVK